MGLGSYWGEVMEVLREIIPIYDKVNSIISLGKDKEHRIRGISHRVHQGNKILDAGSGFGNMSKTAMKLTDGKISITLYDPLVPMLKNTGTYFEKTPDMANGVFEHIPFRDEEFDAVLCGYSLRDAINLRIAISEIHRVLKPGGYAIISTENGSSWHNIFAAIFGWQIFSLTNISSKKSGIGNPLAIHRGKKIDLSSWTHKTIFNHRGLKEFFEAYDFKNTKIVGAGYHPLPPSFGKIDPRHSHYITLKCYK